MKRDCELSLVELTSKKIKDIYGYVSRDFGDPCFKLTRIELESGETIDVEGEHDIPYFCDSKAIIPLPKDEP